MRFFYPYFVPFTFKPDLSIISYMNISNLILTLQSIVALLTAVLNPAIPDSIRQQAVELANQQTEIVISEISTAAYSNIPESGDSQQYTEPTITPAQLLGQSTSTSINNNPIFDLNIIPQNKSVKIEWKTERETIYKGTITGIGTNVSQRFQFKDDNPSFNHSVIINDLKENTIYAYWIQAVIKNTLTTHITSEDKLSSSKSGEFTTLPN